MFIYNMMTKIISISDDAYGQMLKIKEGKESFSKVIMRIMGEKKQRPLTDFLGILPDESVRSIEKAINEGRKKHLYLHKKRLQNAF